MLQNTGPPIPLIKGGEVGSGLDL